MSKSFETERDYSHEEASAAPHRCAIPCLLLQAIGSAAGPDGGNFMTHITYVQRLNTSGGSAPTTGCEVSTDVGKQTLVPYTADCYFFHEDK